MARRITTGIDIGTHAISVVVVEQTRRKDGGGLPRVLGTSSAESRGLRHGYVSSAAEATKSIATAVRSAEKAAGCSIKSAYISVGGVGLKELRSSADTIISRGDLEVTDLDVQQAIRGANEKIERELVNRKVLHEVPLSFSIDGTEIPGRPVGTKGTKLGVEMLFITCFEQHLEDLIKAVEDAGVGVEDVMAAPLAASLVTLSKAQKVAGVVLANIGAETTSLAVFENGTPVSTAVLQIGSADITNDIALGLKVSLEEAEHLKLGATIGIDYSQKKLDEIILARLSDIFELVDKHLVSINKNGLLPAGIVLTGGGSLVHGIDELARNELKLPAKVALPAFGKNPKVKDPTMAVAYGLALWGTSSDDESMGIRIVRETRGGLLAFIKRFLP